MYLGIYDVESFLGGTLVCGYLWALEKLLGSFIDIGAYQEFQKPKFVMPELLLKEL